MHGYHNRFLYIDLTAKTSEVKSFPESVLKTYIGGAGLGAKILFEGTNAGTDPLGPDNLLCFMTGPLTGSKVTGASRHSVVFKSPLSGVWGEASVGGTWGRELRKAGFDGIIFSGQAEKPTYVFIDDGKVELRDATFVWGKDTYDTDSALRAVTHESAVVSTIGPAGEKLARIAGIFTDGMEGRTAARCGVGAVQGSKNLKAVVVHGTGDVPLHDAAGLDASVKALLADFVPKTAGLRNFGTAGLVLGCEQTGDFPVKNWRLGSWEVGAAKISGPKMKESITEKSYYCARCAIGCGRHVKVSEGPYAPVQGAGPEYETLGLIGGSCMVDNLEAIAKINELCNRYGLDTIEVGNSIAMLMEAYEKGLLSEKEIGLKLEWGDADAIISLVHQIGQCTGFGGILAQGLVRAAATLGLNAEELAMHVKGVALPAHDPRAYTSIALGYATSPRGACHLQALSHAFERGLTAPDLGYPAPLERFTPVGKAEMVMKVQNFMALFDAMCLCKFHVFGGVSLTLLADWYNKATGASLSADELFRAGERIFNLKRLYNANCGVAGADDTLPDRILHHVRGTGGAATNLPDLKLMLPEYYSLRGWDKNGKATPETLVRLGLN
jgi:aldehyde:ferredoxin oxidoreductase